MKKMLHLRAPLAIALLALASSCADKPPEKPEGAAVDENRPRLVGRIASIPADHKFVLIQSYGSWNVETGSILTTQGADGRAANLLATGEKLGQYAAADIQSGTLEIGDGVYTVAKIPEPVSPETTVAEPDEPSPESEPD